MLEVLEVIQVYLVLEAFEEVYLVCLEELQCC